MNRLTLIILAAILMLPVSGCAYDYMQRIDRVSYSAGNAVRANIERETANPSSKNKTSTKGLGKNGPVASSGVTVPSL
jgi:hypothetical protein